MFYFIQANDYLTLETEEQKSLNVYLLEKHDFIIKYTK